MPRTPLNPNRRLAASWTARRFKKQVFLSIDLPPRFDSMGQGQKLLLAVEKAVVETLEDMERPLA